MGLTTDPAPQGTDAEAAASLVRDILESLCRRDGLSLESAAVPGEPARNYELADRLGIGHVFGLKAQPDGSNRPGVIPAPIGPELAKELDGYRGLWVSVVNGHVHVSGETAAEVVQNTPPALDPFVFRVPSQALGAFLGIGQGGIHGADH